MVCEECFQGKAKLSQALPTARFGQVTKKLGMVNVPRFSVELKP